MNAGLLKLENMKKNKTCKIPWVFWITIKYNNLGWLYFKTRGGNFLEVHILKIVFDIGMPWLIYTSEFPDYYDEHRFNTNMDNLKIKSSILIKR
jgi:hypothetical protein